MTVPAQPGTSGPLPGDGETNLWNAEFSAATPAEVALYRTPAGGSSFLVDPSAYSVALQTGGGVTITYPLTAARVPTGDFIEVRLAPSFDQPTRLTDQGDYDPAEVMTALDHIVRQTIALKADRSRNIEAPGGITVQVAPPRDGAPLFWRLLSSGAWEISNGTPSSGTSPALRVLYADDLGLSGTGTDETDALNAKILEQSAIGPAIFFLRAAIGYWRFDGQVKNRSGIALAFNSPIRVGAGGNLAFVGGLAREAAGATIRTATLAGATVIPVTPTSGSVSAHFAVEDQIECGSQRVRVTAVDDGANTITITPAANANLSVGETVRRFVSSYIGSSWNRHDTPSELDVADSTLFPLGSVVYVTDDEITTHTDGVQTATVNHEFARVVGFGAGTVKLDRSIRHWMSTANRARVHLVAPCEYATISGATIEFTEAPTSTQVNTFQASFAVECDFLNCAVPNRDNFGTRGRAFNIDRCYAMSVLDCWMGPAKYTAAGEGYGLSIVKSTEITVERFRGVGCRHVLSFSGSTDCSVRGIEGNGWLNNFVDYHSQREIGCWVYQIQGVGNDRTSQGGISLGNPSWRAGVYECGVEQGEITDLQGTGSRGIVAWAPMDDCEVTGVVFRRVLRGIDIRDQAGEPSLALGKLRVACDFHRADQAVLVNMDSNGSTVTPFDRLDLTGSRFFDWVQGIYIDQVAEAIVDVQMESSRAALNGYAVNIEQSGGAYITGRYEGCQRHFRLVDTPARIERYTIKSPNTTNLIDELSAAPVSGGVRDGWGSYPDGWTPARTSAQTDLTVYSLPGMS